MYLDVAPAVVLARRTCPCTQTSHLPLYMDVAPALVRARRTNLCIRTSHPHDCPRSTHSTRTHVCSGPCACTCTSHPHLASNVALAPAPARRERTHMFSNVAPTPGPTLLYLTAATLDTCGSCGCVVPPQ